MRLTIKLRTAVAKDYIEYFKERLKGARTVDGRLIKCSPARVKDDLAYLRTMLKHAWVDWGVPVSIKEIEKAAVSAWMKGYVGKSEARKNRVSVEDLSKIMTFWTREKTGSGCNTLSPTPMLFIVLF